MRSSASCTTKCKQARLCFFAAEGLLLAVLFWGLLAASLSAHGQTYAATELHARGGLPHFFAKLHRGEDVNVAYLGGSITAQEGWRPLTLEYLQQRYPGSHIHEINAAIPGTGSTLGAFRLKHDVLSFKPDLLLVEFTVNDQGGLDTRRAFEGIVRKTWSSNPDTDICFIYTVSASLLPKLLSGNIAYATQASEDVAGEYDIPSINFGVSVAAEVRAGRLMMTGPTARSGSGVAVFSPDGVHPFLQTGHQLYKDAFVRSLPGLDRPTPGPRRLARKAFDPQNLEEATVLSLDSVPHSGSWREVSLPDASGEVARSLPTVWAGANPGDVISFKCKGNLVGIYGVKGPDAGNFSIKIDNGAPEITTFFDPYSTAGRYRIRTWFSNWLPDTVHTVRIQVLSGSPDKAKILGDDGAAMVRAPEYQGTVLYIGGLLVNGDLAR